MNRPCGQTGNRQPPRERRKSEHSRARLMARTRPQAARSQRYSRRTALKGCAAGMLAAGIGSSRPAVGLQSDAVKTTCPRIAIRGIYGGFPKQILDRRETPDDYGVNAIWVGSGSL